VHNEAALGEYEPAGQGVQDSEMREAEYVPAAHQEHPEFELIREPKGQVLH
jgi:hypothetical protein